MGVGDYKPGGYGGVSVAAGGHRYIASPFCGSVLIICVIARSLMSPRCDDLF